MEKSRSLNFSIWRFPVQVHLSFLILTVLLGLNINNPILTLSWIVVVFFSILVHELGHALMAEYYGMFPIIMLYSMGGLTIAGRNVRLSHLQEILLSLAGPTAGFLLGGIIYAVGRFLLPTSPLVIEIYYQLLWVNIGWGVLNLLPILPLDGGHVMRSLWQWFRHSYDERTPLMISIGAGVLVIIAALLNSQPYGAMLGLFFTFNNIMALRSGRMTTY
jgi:Zn-dependent protease